MDMSTCQELDVHGWNGRFNILHKGNSAAGNWARESASMSWENAGSSKWQWKVPDSIMRGKDGKMMENDDSDDSPDLGPIG